MPTDGAGPKTLKPYKDARLEVLNTFEGKYLTQLLERAAGNVSEAALHLAPTHRVAVLTKRAMRDGSSAWAQGGIAAVLAEGDSFDAHVQDTLVAGAGLSDPEATRFVVEHSPESIDWLRGLGVPFSLEDGQLHLTREGGHSARRRRRSGTRGR